MEVLVYFVLFLAMTGRSSAAVYCVCKDGVGDQALQKSLDYACGAGADCSAILQNGACYSPNTVKNHCDYAVNSYFQRKGQASGSCDFAGTATQTQSAPAGSSSTCVYPTSATSSTGSSTTPSTTTPSTTTPSSTTPTGTGTGTGTGTSTGTGTGTGTGTTTSPSVFGLGPTGSGGITSTDSNGAAAPITTIRCTDLFFSAALTLVLSGLVLLQG